MVTSSGIDEPAVPGRRAVRRRGAARRRDAVREQRARRRAHERLGRARGSPARGERVERGGEHAAGASARCASEAITSARPAAQQLDPPRPRAGAVAAGERGGVDLQPRAGARARRRPRRRPASARRSAPDARSASRSRARGPPRSPRGSRRGRRRTAAPPAAPSARPGGPCAIASSSRSPSSATSSWASSAPVRTSSGTPARRSAAATSRTRAGSSSRIPRAQQVAHVRRDGDQRRAVGDGEPRELDRLVEVARPVVDVRAAGGSGARRAARPSTVTHAP